MFTVGNFPLTCIMFLSRMHLNISCGRSKVIYTSANFFPSKSKGLRCISHSKRWTSAEDVITQHPLPSTCFSTLSQHVAKSQKQRTVLLQPTLNLDSIRWYSNTQNPKQDDNQAKKTTDQNRDPSSQDSPDVGGIQDQEDEDKPKGILGRFKDAYKNYGKALVGVHIATSTVWFGTFYYAAYTGLDIVPLLKWLGFSDRIISPFESSGVGDIAVAYLLYKIATPARYTVTIVGTQYTVRYMRKLGYMEPVPEGARLRDFMKESKEQVKGKYEDIKEDMIEKKDEYKEKYEEKMEQYKDKMEEKKTQVKDKLKQ